MFRSPAILVMGGRALRCRNLGIAGRRRRLCMRLRLRLVDPCSSTCCGPAVSCGGRCVADVRRRCDADVPRDPAPWADLLGQCAADGVTAVVLTGIVAASGTAALAGYWCRRAAGTACRLPLVFAIGQALVAHIGIKHRRATGTRAKRIAWTGTAIAASVRPRHRSVCGPSFPRLGASVQQRCDGVVPRPGFVIICVVVGRRFVPGFSAATGVRLYFASQGAGRMAMPVIAGTLRLALALVGGLAAVALGAPLAAIFAVIAFAIAGLRPVHRAGSVALEVGHGKIVMTASGISLSGFAFCCNIRYPISRF